MNDIEYTELKRQEFVARPHNQGISTVASMITAGGNSTGEHAAPIPPTPSQQEAQWQPIETAPRDGRLMIAHNLIMNSTYVVGWDARNKDDGPHWSDVPNRNAAESLWFNGAYFSHWMPLPTRPDEVTK